MTTFDEPDGVQGWESDSRRIFGKRFRPKCAKSALFTLSMVSVRFRVRVRVSFQGVTGPFSTNQMVSKVGKVIEEEFLENVLGPKCPKMVFFENLCLALGLGLAFQGVQ